MTPFLRTTILVWLTTSVAVTAAGPPQARFRSSRDAVLVDVEVTSGGKPVAGLTAGDFELRDSNVPQEVQVLAFADVPISLLLVLDASSSVAGQRLQHLQQAARRAVDALRPDDQAAILAVRDAVSLHVDWTGDRGLLHRRIDALEARGWTALNDAMFAAVALRERAAGRLVVLVFSDGADTASWLDGRQVVERVRRSDVVVTAVSAAARPRPESAREARQALMLAPALSRWFESDPVLFPYALLETLTADSGGELLHVDTGPALAPAFEKIVTAFRTRYLLTFTPEGVSGSGWHPIEVRVPGQRVTVRARRGYWRS
jgi:VWFA-related protein